LYHIEDQELAADLDDYIQSAKYQLRQQKKEIEALNIKMSEMNLGLVRLLDKSELIAGLDTVSLSLLVKVAALHFGYAEGTITGRNKKRKFVDIRSCVVCYAFTYLDVRVHEIAKAFNKHHSSILHLKERAFALIQTDKGFKEKYAGFRKAVADYLAKGIKETEGQ